ncbi:MAG: PHP domain-containing protein [Candidatus Roizmanbacteria bacterium]|nr:PHP domain-containing protein [Candidatus Roizmanbacteria bacterium]
MTSFSNQAIADVLNKVAIVYQLQNENRFKIIAYQQAAEVVNTCTQSIYDVWKEGNIQQINGIGTTIANHLQDYFTNNQSNYFMQTIAQVSPSIFILVNIPGVGPKRAYKLVTNLHLDNPTTALADLKTAIENDEMSHMDGFGTKSQQQLLENLELYTKQSSVEKRMLLPFAQKVAHQLLQYLTLNLHVIRCEPLGSLRRHVETIGDIDIALVAEEKYFSTIIEYIAQYPSCLRVDNKGSKKISIIVAPHIRVDVRLTTAKTFGTMLQYFTGSKMHNIRLREYAQKNDLSLSEYSVTNKKTGEQHTFETEKELYSFLKLDYISPLFREGTDEITHAQTHTLPTSVSLKDIQGDLHIHSNFPIQTSHDIGAHSFTTLLNKAKQLGYTYIGFTEHNPRSKESPLQVVSLLQKRRLQAQKELTNIPITYFLGLEVDIRPDGTLALCDEGIEQLDYIIVSIHSSFRMDQKTATARVLKALSYPKVRIFGHPTGRKLEERNGLMLDWKQIFHACRQRDIALEINSWPQRLDLPYTLVRQAIEAGVRCIINTDAHARDDMDNMHCGITVAQRGWCEKKNIANTLPQEEFKKWLLKQD